MGRTVNVFNIMIIYALVICLGSSSSKNSRNHGKSGNTGTEQEEKEWDCGLNSADDEGSTIQPLGVDDSDQGSDIA